ncbi:hypothetical protein DCO58_06505 [Helicobacter saguini]|uniref:Uncharacterized protein n=1 Tax=Helicobacter saguini TaxID=1548018 RepID=A0A6B0HYG5_9HELI|nr:hypothetical protein [Helicobacter saguini]MWV62012.1 hypothetical protein [Helicobacter saguini]MWV67313.1 hypothetical protein [Helicobacter saguini]MWV69666.1 hypothetical protein [Helicobacter saguini]MWV73117.1 hypothetical protein [Helicobacter saguini]
MLPLILKFIDSKILIFHQNMQIFHRGILPLSAIRICFKTLIFLRYKGVDSIFFKNCFDLA